MLQRNPETGQVATQLGVTFRKRVSQLANTHIGNVSLHSPSVPALDILFTAPILHLSHNFQDTPEEINASSFLR
jgi:hypothetical protein